MSISVSTDIVMDVLKAATPRKAAVAAAKLQGTEMTARAKANQQFEAVMLRSMVEDMLPKDSSAIYGEGTAGNIWRSMQADFISQELSKAGGVGIAKMLNKSQDRIGNAADAASLNQILPRADNLTPIKDWPYFEVAGKPA
jgi:Rod binding domain-containing protein